LEEEVEMSNRRDAVGGDRLARQDRARSVSARARLCFFVFGIFCLCLACDFALARATPPNADSVQNFNEVDSVFSGNVLLSHWVLASDSFYLTDLPFYVLGRALFGNHLWLIYVVPFAVYDLLLGVSLWLVWRARPFPRPFGALMLLCLIGVPFAPGQFMFLVSAFHTATVLFSLVAVVAIAPVLTGGQAGPGRYLFFSAALFIACASDPMADIFMALPLLLFLLLESWRQRRVPRTYLVLAGCIVAVLLWAVQFPDLIERAHGFISRPSYSRAPVADLSSIAGNAQAVIGALGILFGIRDLPAMSLVPVVSFIRALFALWVLFSVAVLLASPRAAPRPSVAQFLVLAASCLLVADCLSVTFTGAITPGPGYPNAAVRYVAPAYLFLCIAAALAPVPLPAPALARRLFGGAAWFSGAVMFAALMAFGLKSLSAPPGLQVPPAYELAGWLYARHLTYGVGDYYTTQLVRALSSAQVMADPMVVCRGQLCPDRFWTDTTRFDSNIRPQFVIFPPSNWFGLTEVDAVEAYGPPLAVTSVRGVTVLLYVQEAPSLGRLTPRDVP